MRIFVIYNQIDFKIKEFQSVYAALEFIKHENLQDFAIINGQYIESSIK